MTNVTFYFDLRCPWTWRASRWLIAVAPERDLSLRWRAFSLTLLREREMDAQPSVVAAPDTEAFRLVEALTTDGRHDDAGRFYTTLGTWLHVENLTLTPELVAEAAEQSGVADRLEAAYNETWDEAVGAALDRALALAGPDVGSPVLQFADATRGLHGPILTAVPQGEAALAVWDCVCTLASTPEFCEVKRGRP